MTMTPSSQHDPTDVPLHVFIVAGEASGDRLGAALIKALRQRLDLHVKFSGVGGEFMAAQGVASLFPIRDLAIIGLTSIPRRLPLILRRIRQAADAVVATRPDVLVIIDSPDLTHRIARRVRRLCPQIPIVDYVSPTVWAWRPGRARAMRHYVDHVLAVLPFEPAVLAKLGGPPSSYVGHPLAEELDQIRPRAEETPQRSSEPPLVLVLPGSRASEVRLLLDTFGAAIALVRKRSAPFDLVLPTLPHLAAAVTEGTARWPQPPRIVVESSEKQAAFRRARAALAKSGTVTLELALAGVPMVTAYKLSLFDEMVAHLVVSVDSVILPNLVLGERAIPELLLRACTPENLAAALAPLLGDTPERRRQVEALARLDAIMEIGSAAPSQRAADVVLGLAARRPIST